jgi:hypothetical protein
LPGTVVATDMVAMGTVVISTDMDMVGMDTTLTTVTKKVTPRGIGMGAIGTDTTTATAVGGMVIGGLTVSAHAGA